MGNKLQGGILPLVRASFDWLREAAGLLTYAREVSAQAKLDRLFEDAASSEVSTAALDLLRAALFCDAEAIPVAQAMNKGNSASLISSLAFGGESQYPFASHAPSLSLSLSLSNNRHTHPAFDNIHRARLAADNGSKNQGDSFRKWLAYADYKEHVMR